MKLIFIFIIFIVGFLGGLLTDLKILPQYTLLISEASTYILFCIAIGMRRKESSISFHMSYIYIFLILVALSSAILNSYLNINIIIGLRNILRFYVFYLALINLELSEKQYKTINNFLFFLFIIQLPASAIRFIFRGVSEETIGTYASHGGGLTPIIPIIAIGYIVGFYAAVKPRLIYLFLCILFALYGVAGGKRAIIFFYPIAFLGIYYLAFIRTRKISFFRNLGVFVLMMTLMIGLMVLSIKVMPSLNPENKQGGTVSTEHIMNFAKQYETSTGSYGSGSSRLSTTILTFKTLYDAGMAQIVFGFGPGSISGSALDTITGDRRRTDERLKPITRSYGLTGFAYILLEYGIIGVTFILAVFIIFMSRSLKWLRLETAPYWKALAIGTVVMAFTQTLIFLSYNVTPVLDKTIVPVYFYAMALAYYRVKGISRTNRMALRQNLIR